MSNFRLSNVFTIAVNVVTAIVFFVALAGCHDDNCSRSSANMIFHERGGFSVYPQVTDVVSVNLSYGLEDSILFNSSTLDVPMEFPMLNPTFSGDLYEGLRCMSIGDSATIEVVADSFFIITAGLSGLPPFVTSGEAFFYHIKLLDFQSRSAFDSLMLERNKNRHAEEKKVIYEYLENFVPNYEAFPSGLIKILTNSGSGSRPDTGDMCQVFFEVRILSGDTLYSNYETNAFDIEFGKDFDNEGFMEALGSMQEGEISRFIVPSIIGVGENGYDGVAGFTTLDYTLNFVKIRPLEVVKEERKKRAEAKRKKKSRK